MRGYGPPTVAPVEFGIHYIDVTSGDMYLSRGKVDVDDWGQPLKAAMVDGEEGKTFGWNDGQTWYVLDIGVQKEIIDQKDVDTLNSGIQHSSTRVTELGAVATALLTASNDNDVKTSIQQYTNAQFDLIAGTPGGGDVGTVMAKLSNADRDAHWLPVVEGEVLQTTMQSTNGEIQDHTNVAIAALRVVEEPNLDVDSGSVVTSTSWVEKVNAVSTPTILYPLPNGVVPSEFTIIGTPFNATYDVERLYREFEVKINGLTEIYTSNSDQYRVKCSPGDHITIKIRDVTEVGESGWGEVSVTSATITTSARLTTGSINGAINLPATFSVIREVVGSVDDHTQTSWIITNNVGDVVFSSPLDPINVTAISVPDGTLLLNEQYTIKAITHGKLWGDVETEETVTTAGIKMLYAGAAATTSPRSKSYSQSIDAFTLAAGSALLPADETDTTIRMISPDKTFAVAISSTSPFIHIYRRVGAKFTKDGVVQPVVPGIVHDVSFSVGSRILAVAHAAAPFVTLFRVDINANCSSGPVLSTPVPNSYTLGISPSGHHLIVRIPSTSPSTWYTLALYILSGDVYVKSSTGAPSVNSPNITRVIFNPKYPEYVGVTPLNYNSAGYVQIFKWTGTAYASTDVLLTGGGNARAFNFDDSGLQIAGTGSESKNSYMVVATFDPTSGKTTIIKSYSSAKFNAEPFGNVAFNPDGDYLAYVWMGTQIMCMKFTGTVWSGTPITVTTNAGGNVSTLEWFYEK